MNGVLEPLSELSLWLFRASLRGSVIIGIIIALKFILKNKLTARQNYALWIVMIISLIFPGSVLNRISPFNWVSRKTGTPSVFQETNIVSSDWIIAASGSTGTENTAFVSDYYPPSLDYASSLGGYFGTGTMYTSEGLAVYDSALQNVLSSKQVGASQKPFTPVQVLSLVWGMGFILFLIISVIPYFVFLFKLKSQKAGAGKKTNDIFNECRRKMGSLRRIPIIETGLVDNPVALGFLFPKILLPVRFVDRKNESDIRHILLHEIAHHKLLDTFNEWILTLVRAVHWYNPLVWYAYGRIKIDREMACDEHVLSVVGESESKSYGETILRMIRPKPLKPRLMDSFNVFENNRHLKKRLTKIVRFGKRLNKLWFCLGMAFMVIVFLASGQPGGGEFDINFEFIKK